MRVRSIFPWLLVSATALCGMGIGTVLAQAIKEPGWPPPDASTCKATKKDTEDAQTLYKLGMSAYNISNYADAIKYWKDAYKRDCSAHLLLKNLGKAYEADSQYAAAVEVYRLFRVRAKVAGDELDLIDAKIANLSKKIGGSSEPTPSGTTTAAPIPTATATVTAAPTTTATVAPTSSVPTPPAKGPGVAPWIMAGAGGAVAIGGTILALSSDSTVKSKFASFEEKGCKSSALFNSAECQDLKTKGESAQTTRTIGWVMTGVGVAALGTGIVWALVGGKKAEPTTGLTIGPGPGLAGIGLFGHF